MARRVKVDELTCELHGKCQESAPGVFRLGDDDDWSQVLVDQVPEDQVESVERAIRTCPRQAISWVDA